MTLFSIGKTMAVDGNNKCTAFCPVSGSLDSFGIDSNATYAGQVEFQGKTVDSWTWQDSSPFGVMSTTVFYVDASGSSPVPVQQAQHLTPFGQDLGKSNSTCAFPRPLAPHARPTTRPAPRADSSFQAGTPSASLFDVTGIDSCPKSQNCNSNVSVPLPRPPRALSLPLTSRREPSPPSCTWSAAWRSWSRRASPRWSWPERACRVDGPVVDRSGREPAPSTTTSHPIPPRRAPRLSQVCLLEGPALASAASACAE